jgi:hypothetical protein
MRRTRHSDWGRYLRLIVVSDLIAIGAGVAVADVARSTITVDTGLLPAASVNIPVSLNVFAACTWLLALLFVGAHRRENLLSGIGEYQRVLSAGAIAVLTVIFFTYVRTEPSVPRGYLVFVFLAVGVFVSVGRFSVRRVMYRHARRGRHLDRAVVVGTSQQAISVARQLQSSPSASSEVVGFLSDHQAVGTEVLPGLRVLGEPLQLRELCARLGVTRAIVMQSALWWESMRALVEIMHSPGEVEIVLVPGLFDVHSTPMAPRRVGPVFGLVPHSARVVGADALLKRAFDLAIGIPAFLLSLPLLSGLVAYSMVRGSGTGISAEDCVGPSRTYRLYRLDRPDWLRRVHLSRLPSLVLVLTGRMSVVGPRPLTIDRTADYEAAMSHLRAAKPGFVGPWWLVGRARPLDVGEELLHDLHYLANYSIWLDIHVVWQVLRSFLGRQQPLEPVHDRVPRHVQPVPATRLLRSEAQSAPISS